MRILDWRPRGEQFLTALWRGQVARPRGEMGVGRLWNDAHDRLVKVRVGRRPAAPGNPVIVSVGNLALGGTGKTPVVIALARDLAARGHRGCVLTRGFRSPLAGPIEVLPDNPLAGDEARLLAQTLGPVGWPVVQAKARPAGLRHVLAGDEPPTVVLLEDGHQTAGIGRDLDVLILDHWEIKQTDDGPRVAPLTGAVFPGGPWRESAAGAGRARIWLLETNAEVPALGEGGSSVVTFQRTFSCRAVAPEQNASTVPEKPALVSGIARPDKFEAGARGLLGEQSLLAVRLADHEPYGPRLVARLRQAMDAAGCGSLVTTEKDWIKLASFWPAAEPVFVIQLDIAWGNGKTLSDLVGERL